MKKLMNWHIESCIQIHEINNPNQIPAKTGNIVLPQDMIKVLYTDTCIISCTCLYRVWNWK